MKSVLISIHPKLCELIASGEKTIEVRKTRPKVETPFKCYIYETKARSDMPTFIDEDGHVIYTGRGQVIGEFVCDRIDPIKAVRRDGGSAERSWKSIFTFMPSKRHNALLNATGMETEKIYDYLGGEGKWGYAWHISDLKIYDRPRPLSDFTRLRATKFGYEPVDIERPPQSWFYVEDTECTS